MNNRVGYYEGLRSVTEQGDWHAWILYILDAIEATATLTREKLLQIHTLIQETITKARTELKGIYSKDLIEAIFHHPYCKISFLEEVGIAKRQAASKYLQELERVGILRQVQTGREKYYTTMGKPVFYKRYLVN